MTAQRRAALFAYAILGAMLCLAFLVAAAFIGAVTGEPLRLPTLRLDWLGAALLFLAQGAFLALIMWRFLPAFMVRFDKGVTERDERIAALQERVAYLERAVVLADERRDVATQRATTAEARLESAGGLINELRANAAGWEESARHAANERDQWMKRADELARELEKAQGAQEAAEGAAVQGVQGVAAFVHAVAESKARGVQPLSALARAHLGVPVNPSHKDVQAAFTVLREAIPYRAAAPLPADATAEAGPNGAEKAEQGSGEGVNVNDERGAPNEDAS